MDELRYAREVSLDRVLPMADVRRMGAYIRWQREKAGLTQEELADRMGITQGVLSGWERGQVRRIPTGDVLRRIAAALNVTEADLLRVVGYLADVPAVAVSEPDVPQAFTLLMRAIDDDGALSDNEKRVLREHLQTARQIHEVMHGD